jgi:hypothetical protein
MIYPPIFVVHLPYVPIQESTDHLYLERILPQQPQPYSKEKIERSCLKCEFWDQDKTNILQGPCRRYAPRPYGQDNTWPSTSCDEWCGEFDKVDEGEISKRQQLIDDKYPLGEIVKKG